MVHKVLEIANEEGLKAKAAAEFVHTASKFTSHILIEKGNKKINAKSIMGVLSLGVAKGESIHLVVNGTDEKDALTRLTKLVKSGFIEE